MAIIPTQALPAVQTITLSDSEEEAEVAVIASEAEGVAETKSSEETTKTIAARVLDVVKDPKVKETSVNVAGAASGAAGALFATPFVGPIGGAAVGAGVAASGRFASAAVHEGSVARFENATGKKV